ncbi:MAG: hypothetical protein L6R36_007947 [Xanthoria steineri]|nr:MAG: hypothetical protein L6R36_007947 [Xanthoria steineri]
MENSTTKRSSSRNRPPSRPTTPLRPSSRTSLRESQTFTPGGGASSAFPLDSLEPAFAEFSDSMADLEANLMHLQLMHESLSRFNENFASFLYGLNMNAFCVDFPEAPIPESFKRARPVDDATPTPEESYKGHADSDGGVEQDPEASFLTTDTSFFDKPASAKKPSRYATSASSTSRPSSVLNNKRGTNVSTSTRGARGSNRGTRASGIARGKPRGAG